VRVCNVAIQPIVHADLTVQGYELLFRGNGGGVTTNRDGAMMTSNVVLSALIDNDLDGLVGDHAAYVNVPCSMLIEGLLITNETAYPAGKVYLEIPETAVPDPELIDALTDHARAGFLLALDDYTGQQHQQALLPYVHTVKVDLPCLSPAALADILEPLESGRHQLVAEKVETIEQLDTCKALGFDLFQGYLLSRPVVHNQGVLAPSRAMCLRLLSTLADAGAETHEIRRLVESDPALSLRLLRVASLGAAGGARRAMKSVTEAIVLLGVRRLSALVILTLLADDGGAPSEQLVIAMTRARMCELLAREGGLDDERSHTIGLLSAMDLLLGMPLVDVLARTDLDDDVRDALLHRTGPHGQLLAGIVDYETGGRADLSGLGYSADQVGQAYLDALSHARTTFASLLAAV
jgi:EAL and modified HD-GYP domain-containing signal transduction protein